MSMLPGLGTKILSEVFVDDNAADGSSDDYHGVFFSHKLARCSVKIIRRSNVSENRTVTHHIYHADDSQRGSLSRRKQYILPEV